MKLGEALSHRARMASKLADLQGRVLSSVVVQEGDEPAEDAKDLIERFVTESEEFCALVKSIQLTNAQTVVDKDGLTINGLMQQREHLRRQRNLLRSVASQASTSQYRYSRTEIKMVSVLDAKEQQEEIEKLDTQLEEVDLRLQTINWATDLVEAA